MSRPSSLQVLLFVLLFLQLIFGSAISLGLGHCNFLLVGIFILAINESSSRVYWWAFAGGCLYDLLNQGPLGLMALLFVALVFVLQNVRRDLAQSSLGTLSVQFVLLSAALELLYCFIASLYMGGVSILVLLFMRVLPACLLDLLVFLAVWLLFRRHQVASSLSGASQAPSLSANSKGSKPSFTGRPAKMRGSSALSLRGASKKSQGFKPPRIRS